ncbi:2-hydroxy-acid oxidase [Azorhizobium oxalatiphilum]|uniref:2-hydroxy-acid oxidase n=1 Tax=Azorhizobium oxalatiphilum TaxID=980631 RepID=A0A917CAA2_9HYPH|nr:glycolate oxidase subunit GlcE [Azorhizobium oxalatiphilum]GGF80730.1 2-hydroxy-acid oxidase [Azorhizobium oxalatiphilum]
MTDVVKVADEAGLVEAVRAAIEAGKTLDVCGRGSKRDLGRPGQTDWTLDLSALAGVTLYEPEELILSAKGGTPVAEIEAMLKERGQMLAFEPLDYGPLLGGAEAAGSIGGVVACNLAGPRRISHGAARDHALGARAVSGRAEAFKSGGRVVKNVTGYDLPRLLAGSYGTLAVLSEFTLKVLPRPPMEETVVLPGVSPEAAAKALSAAMGSSCEVSGAAYLPGPVAARIPELKLDVPAVVLRLEGFEPSVRARRAMMISVLMPFGGVEVVETAASPGLWASIRDVRPFVGTGARAVWRLSTAPAAGPALAARLAEQFKGETFCDWAGGLIWLLMPGEASEADKVRAALAPHGGHATLVRATSAERAAVPVFQPMEPTLAALTQRVKASFDPMGVLNPGRMYAGM